MSRLFTGLVNKVMGSFVGSGVSLDERGRLCLPDGLDPDRVHLFIELVMNERFASPRAAMHALFATLGVSPRVVSLLNEIIDANGDVEFTAAAKRSRALLAALPEFKQIPTHFRDFLVHDLALAAKTSKDLEQAVASARKSAAARLACSPTWNDILARTHDVTELARPWRERTTAAAV